MAFARGGPGASDGDLSMVRDAQPGLASGPNSPWDLNQRLSISSPVSFLRDGYNLTLPVIPLYSEVSCGSP